MIKTIDDLKTTTKEELEQAIQKVTVLEDLNTYIKWLNSPEGTMTEIHFKVGWNKHRAASLGLHPSQLSKADPCLLKLYYEATGKLESKPQVDPTLYMTFDIGTAAHSLLQTHFLHMYEDQFEEEVWLKDKRLLIHSSHTDGRFHFKDVRFLLEIKTIKEGGNFGWEKVQDRPFDDHVRQVMTYMYLDKCPFGLILYWCKNNSKLKEHVVVWSDQVWNEIEGGTIDPVLKSIEEDTEPVANPGYHCRWCDFLHGCGPGKGNKNGKRNSRRGVVNSRNGARHVRSWGSRS